MKKIFAFLTIAAVLSLGSCARRANCPAYGQVQKTQPTLARHA